MQANMVIENLDPDSAEVQALLAVSNAYYVNLYPAESNHLESSGDLKKPNVLFVGCRVDGELVASGDARIMQDDGSYAEIKRVFVLDDHRGKGLSSQLMRFLEAELQSRGVSLFRLETGIKQPEALGLYRKLGYLDRGPFGSYRADPFSVFMEKRVKS
jgi:putative acetyltransferase